MYLVQVITDDAEKLRYQFQQLSKTNMLVLVAYFSCFSAIFQAAGGIFPGVGYFISPLATAPLFLCAVLSLRLGIFSYILTMCLLLVIQPSELIIFPFTTGLLGLGMGFAFTLLKNRLNIIFGSAISLILGIMFLLYIIKFPILGPGVSSLGQLSIVCGVIIFSLLYSWFWVEISVIFMRRLKKIIIW